MRYILAYFQIFLIWFIAFFSDWLPLNKVERTYWHRVHLNVLNIPNDLLSLALETWRQNHKRLNLFKIWLKYIRRCEMRLLHDYHDLSGNITTNAIWKPVLAHSKMPVWWPLLGKWFTLHLFKLATNSFIKH